MTSFRPAALPMYDADRTAVHVWWRALASAMRARGLTGVPDEPEWPGDLMAHWREPRLLLSQTCGYPIVAGLSGAVQVVGAFRYAVPGCEGICYRSNIVVRSSEVATSIEGFRGRTVAFNERQSHSGHNAMLALIAPLSEGGRFFSRAIESGSHRASLALLRAGEADVAAIDCVSQAALQRAAPGLLQGLKVIGHTRAVPGLPLVTSALTPPHELAALREALGDVVADPALADLRAGLFISGFEVVPASAWDVIVELRRGAVRQGCFAL